MLVTVTRCVLSGISLAEVLIFVVYRIQAEHRSLERKATLGLIMGKTATGTIATQTTVAMKRGAFCHKIGFLVYMQLYFGVRWLAEDF